MSLGRGGGVAGRKAGDFDGSLQQFLKDYAYQLELTKRLDAVGTQPFTHDVIKDIVLWKVNRYVELSGGALSAFNGVDGLRPKSHREAMKTLATLLREPGVDLAMASTFLRFRNPKAFQIIDRHAYRALYGESYPLYFSSPDRRKIDVYFRYLDDVWALAESKNVDFELLDRVLYVFDKQVNGSLRERAGGKG